MFEVFVTSQGHPYLNTPTSAVQFNPYLNTGMPTIAVQSNGESHPLMSHPGVIPNAIPNATAGKVQRPDRLEVGHRHGQHVSIYLVLHIL